MDEVAAGPKVLPDEVSRPAREVPGDVDRALPLDIPDHTTEYCGGIDNMI